MFFTVFYKIVPALVLIQFVVFQIFFSAQKTDLGMSVFGEKIHCLYHCVTVIKVHGTYRIVFQFHVNEEKRLAKFL